jgi:folate-dependent phosphoribosylglycinamide formyltransferase PurN
VRNVFRKKSVVFLIGSGAGIIRAAKLLENLRIELEGVCITSRSNFNMPLSFKGFPIFYQRNEFNNFFKAISNLEKKIILSINNEWIIPDKVVSSVEKVYNIHNGLIQKYRGISEVCMIAAIVNREREYGATIHELQIGNEVDSGPVVAQRRFNLPPYINFQQLMKISQNNCFSILEENILGISSGHVNTHKVEISSRIYTYIDVPNLLKGTDNETHQRATDLGPFRPYLPKLEKCL